MYGDIMDIKEIKSLKQKLEFDILHLLTEFHKQTGVFVPSVRVDFINNYDLSGRKSYLNTEVTVEAII